MEVKKLNEVTLVESVGDEANVLIEEGEEIKRVPKTAIGAQADWNETDELSPAFIMNKPTSLSGGGYTYYSYYNNHLYKSDGTFLLAGEEPTRAEFEEIYMKSPIMILGGTLSQGTTAPLIWYKLSDGKPYIGLVNYYGGGITTYNINFPS